MSGKISYLVRTAGIEDVEAIVDLGRRTFATTFSSDNDPAHMKAYTDEAFSSERILAELEEPESSYLLVMDGDNVAGYGRIKRGRTPDCVKGSDAAELERIYVDEPWLGKGAGTFLMSALLEEAGKRGYQSIWLGVWEHNHHAIQFYEKCGLAVVGEKRFLLGGDKQTDLVMSRELD
jgi:ribosomal protein S18 acetylase RimI-like enzyme